MQSSVVMKISSYTILDSQSFTKHPTSTESDKHSSAHGLVGHSIRPSPSQNNGASSAETIRQKIRVVKVENAIVQRLGIKN